MKSEGRGGGPNDPVKSFEAVYSDLYLQSGNEEKKQDAKAHPIYELILKYSFEETPGQDAVSEDTPMPTDTGG